MKNILLFLAILSMGCSQDKVAEQPVQQTTKGTEKVKVKNVIRESGVRNLLLQKKEGKTWRDVDSFYKDMLVKFKDSDQLDYLRGYVITVLVRNYRLAEVEGNEILPVIEYYMNEQLTLNTPNPYVFFKCLERLKGYWNPTQISKAARTGYEKNAAALNYIAGETDNPTIKERREYTEKLEKLIVN